VHPGPAHDEPGGNGSGAPRAVAAASAAAPLAAGQAAMRQPATDASAVRGLPADPMRTARQNPGDAAATNGNARPGYTPSGARIGRNDPCWCGSGQKYKKCHGA
jgi:preprotein translocase subunit SecA